MMMVMMMDEQRGFMRENIENLATKFLRRPTIDR